jgi:aryl-alcohol dehydrogenase
VLRRRGGPLELEEVEIEGPRHDEVLVRLESVGICRSDTHALSEVPLPAVLGHEGAGVVEAVGSSVERVALGDLVVMTFRSCGTCPRCWRGESAYCDHFLALNFSGRRPDGSSALSSRGEPLYAHFLGQSCFATHAVAQERSVVALGPEVDLSNLGPFGCGFQTGAGAVLNALRPAVGSSIAVLGAGAVGLASVAGAVLAGCDPIVVVDLDRRRLEDAEAMGATRFVDAGGDDVSARLSKLVPLGLDYALDTTGVAGVVAAAVGALHTRGVCGIIGAGPSSEVVLDWRTVMNGRTITGIIAGSSVPQVFLPKLIALYQAGRFPIDRLVASYPFEQINEALAASERGDVVKPVLRFGTGT